MPKGKASLKPKFKKFTPKFTVKEFIKDVHEESAVIAQKFIKFVNEDFLAHDYKKLNTFVGAEVKPEELLKSIQLDDAILFIKNDKAIGSYTYKELVSIIEFGRKDLGVMPDPIITVAFEAFRKEYKKEVKKFLTGK